MALPPLLSKRPQSSRKVHQRSVGLQTLLLCFFTGVATIPVLFLGAWVYHSAHSAREQSVAEKHQLLARTISDELAGYADDLETLFEERSQGEPQPFSEEGKTLLRSKNVQMLAFIEQTQNLYCMGDGSWLPREGISALDEQKKLAQQQPGTTYISPVFINQHNTPTFYLLRVNNVRKLVIAAISTEHFMNIQQRIDFGESGHAAIVDQNGRVLAHPLSAWERNARKLSALKPIEQMQERGEGVARFYSPALKDEMIAGYAVVPEVGWGVMIPQRYREIQAQALETKKIALLLSAGGLALAVTISWQLTRYILTPIQAVIAAAKALESGQLVPSLSTTTLNARPRLPKELTHLLLAFDQMAAEVSLTRSTLEQRVKERTQKLAAEVNRRTQLEQQLIQQATHDALTGLPNRRLLTERLQSLIALSRRSGDAFALLFLDLDGFKTINDTYGHSVGDRLLVQVSQRLKASLRECDSVFRLGGDEFVVLAEQMDAETVYRKIGVLTDKIIATLQRPFYIQKRSLSVGVSIGAKIATGDHTITADQLLEAADRAMYQAKLAGNCAVIDDDTVCSLTIDNETRGDETRGIEHGDRARRKIDCLF